MQLIQHTVRALIALLVAIGVQLPCPCPALADAAETAASESSDHSCCPGMDEAEPESDSSEHSDEGHACSHCEDDTYTRADTIELPSFTASRLPDWNDVLEQTFDERPAFGDQLFTDSTQWGRPPPLAPRSLPSGRQIQTLHCTYLC